MYFLLYTVYFTSPLPHATNLLLLKVLKFLILYMLVLNIALTVTCKENILSKGISKNLPLIYEFRILIDVI